MKKFLLLLVSFPFVLFLPGVFFCSCGDEASNLSEQTGQVAGLTPEQKAQAIFLKNFESFFKVQLEAAKCPGAAFVIVKDSTVIFEKGFGVKSSGSKDAVDIHTVFRLASLSKGFTGILTGKMVQEGFLGWDDKVKEIIPAFSLKDRRQAARITVKNLLTHTTGLPRHAYTNLIEAGQTIDEIIPQFARVKLIGKEGELFAYQNAAFSIIEKILQKKTGLEFQTLLADQLFKPAGMKNASASYEVFIQNNNIASPHDWNAADSSFYPVPVTRKYYNTASAGGINASIHDMGIWLQILLGARPEIVSNETLDAVFAPFIESQNESRFFQWEGVTRSSYGMGWRIFEFEGAELVYHGGYVNDYRSEIAIDRKNKIAVCALFNAPNPVASTIVPEFFKAFWRFENPAGQESFNIR